MATFVRTTAINPSELDTKFEEHRLLIAAKANQIQADQLAEQIVQLNAEKMSRLGGSIALGPLYGVSANTSTGNALATVDDVVRLATEIANAIVAGTPSGTPPAVTQQPVISVVGGGSATPGAVLQIATAATFSNANTPTKVWQANQGSATLVNSTSGDTYTVDAAGGDTGKSISILYTATSNATPNPYGDATARSNAITAQDVVSSVDARLSLGLDDWGLANEATFAGIPSFGWTTQGSIVMGAYPHGWIIPSWSTPPVYYENWPRVMAWFHSTPGPGNTATNAAIEISGMELWFLLNSTKTWTKLWSADKPVWSDRYTSDFGSTVSDDDIWETSSFVYRTPLGYISHGGSGIYDVPWTGGGYTATNVDDVAAVAHFVRFRLRKYNTGGADDLDNAVYVIAAGADYYPPAGGNTSVLPSVACGRGMLATRDWRIARMVCKRNEIDRTTFLGYTQPTWDYAEAGGGGEGGGGDTALDFGGGSQTNSSRYANFTMPTLGAAWSIGFRLRANVILNGDGVTYQTLLASATNPFDGGGIIISIDPWGYLRVAVNQNSGTWWNANTVKYMVGGGGDWAVVVTQDGSNWNIYAYPAGSAVSAATSSSAKSGSGITSQDVRIGRYHDSPETDWLRNPLGDLFIIDSAMSAANVQSFTQGAAITTIDATPLVDLPFRDGSAGSLGGGVEDNLGDGGATNDATISGTGWATTTAFT